MHGFTDRCEQTLATPTQTTANIFICLRSKIQHKELSDCVINRLGWGRAEQSLMVHTFVLGSAGQ
jgi:hypothetical protein